MEAAAATDTEPRAAADVENLLAASRHFQRHRRHVDHQHAGLRLRHRNFAAQLENTGDRQRRVAAKRQFVGPRGEADIHARDGVVHRRAQFVSAHRETAFDRQTIQPDQRDIAGGLERIAAVAKHQSQIAVGNLQSDRTSAVGDAEERFDARDANEDRVPCLAERETAFDRNEVGNRQLRRSAHLRDICRGIELHFDRRAADIDRLVDGGSHTIDAGGQRALQGQTVDAHERRRSASHQRVLGTGLRRRARCRDLLQHQAEIGAGNQHAHLVGLTRVRPKEHVDVRRARQNLSGRDIARHVRGPLEREVATHPHELVDFQRHVARELHDVGAVIELHSDGRSQDVDRFVDRRLHPIDTRCQSARERQSVDAHERGRAFRHERVLGAGLGRQRTVRHLPQHESQFRACDRNTRRIGGASIRAKEDVDVRRRRRNIRRRHGAVRFHDPLEREGATDRHEIGDAQRDASRELHHIAAIVELDLNRRALHVDGPIDRRAHLVDAGRQRAAQRQTIHSDQRPRSFRDQRVLRVGLGRQTGVGDLLHHQSQFRAGDLHTRGIRRARVRTQEDVDVRRGRDDLRGGHIPRGFRLALERERPRHRHESGNRQRHVAGELHHIGARVELHANRRAGDHDGLVDRAAHPVHAGRQIARQRQAIDTHQRRRTIGHEGVLRRGLRAQARVVHLLHHQTQLGAGDLDAGRLRGVRIGAEENVDVRRRRDDLRRRRRSHGR